MIAQNLQSRSWDAFEKQEWEQAKQLCTQRLNQNTLDMDALFLAGLIAKIHGHISQALAYFSSIVRHTPHNTDAWLQLGLCYEETNTNALPREILLEKACEAFQRGLLNNDQHLPCLFNLIRVLSSLGQYENALPFSKKALATGLDNATAQMILAKNLHDLRCFDEAEVYYTQALTAQPNNLLWQWEYAMQLLMTGNFEKGWQHYDARLTAFDWINSGLQMYPFSFPLWQGEDLTGKTILVHGEQGLGDEIMFASLIPSIIEKAGRVILACSPSLVDLFTRSFPCEVVGHYRGIEAIAHWQQGVQPPFLKALHNIDFQCPMGSLPRYLRTSKNSFENPQPYLKASETKVKEWNKKLIEKRTLSQEPTLRVGIMWCGNLNTGLMGNQKSIPLNMFSPLTKIEGIEWIGLQNAEYGVELSGHKELGIVDVSSDIKSFDDTASIIANVDLVISVDTSVAHLAGAMGKEVWVPLCINADWRWQQEGGNSLWYSSMQLIRQIQTNEWSAVIADLQQRLIHKIS